MLTADLVSARRRGDRLIIAALDDETRARALVIAEDLLAVAEEHVGRTRDEVDQAAATIEVDPQEQRLRAGLAKLIDDRCTFDAEDGVDPEELRRDVFTRAAALRRAATTKDDFDRAALLAEVAKARGLATDAIERGLYADLRGAHLLCAFERTTPAELVAAYERGQAQAVLLRAVKVTIDVACSPGAARALFHKLKFLRLLHTIEKSERGHRIVIDGPFSLFESVTKYGLQLAMVLPALDTCEAWSLEADVRWGKERRPLVFRLEGGASSCDHEVSLPDDVAELVRAIGALDTKWRASPSTAILELPGVGLCVPDLVLELKKPKRKVYLEVMGYWSRDAVWRRVELVQKGLAAPIVFAASKRLRVSEEVLEEGGTAALYVYKGTMSARAVIERVERLAAARR